MTRVTVATIGSIIFAWGAVSAPSTASPSAQRGSSIVDESAMVQACAKLSKNKRGELLERCVEVARATEAPQVALVDAWVARFDGTIKKLPEPTEFDAHDAKRFKGGHKRRLVKEGSRDWDSELRPQIEPPTARWTRRVDYEFATGLLVRTPIDKDDVTWELRNLLQGILPDQDLAEALVVQALDGNRPVMAEAEFFAHLYTDREQRAYEGISMYAAWSLEGFQLEVPDVEAHAYAIKIWRDDSLPVPLTDFDHQKWYPRIAESLQKLKAHERTIRALAAVWFDGKPKLEHGYENSIDIMQGLIARANEDATLLAQWLERDGVQFLHKGLEELDSLGDDAWNAGNARRDALADGNQEIREAVLALLAEEGLTD